MMVERDLPRSMPELAAHTTAAIVGGLTPAMLGVLLLNICGIAAAIYFLRILILGQQLHLGALLAVQERQMAQFYTMEARHFGVFTDMIKGQQADMKDLKTQLPLQEDVGMPLPLPRP